MKAAQRGRTLTVNALIDANANANATKKYNVVFNIKVMERLLLFMLLNMVKLPLLIYCFQRMRISMQKKTSKGACFI